MFDEPVNQILSGVLTASADDFGMGAPAGGAEVAHAVNASALQTTRIDARIT